MNRKISEVGMRKLMRLGKTSLAVTIPREVVLELGWRQDQKVMVKREGKKIVIEDWKD